MLTATSAIGAHASLYPYPFSSPLQIPPRPHPHPLPPLSISPRAPSSLLSCQRPPLLTATSAAAAAAADREGIHLEEVQVGEAWERSKEESRIDGLKKGSDQRETSLYSIAPYPLLFAAIPGAETVRSIFGPFAELVKTWNLPDWLVHWGHPGNMAVVLFAMGGYGTYLGFRIRLSKDAEEKAMAKDLHPKLLGGMFFFFALGATGGITALLTSDKPILESPHAVTALMGLSLLTVQTILPALFEENPGLRTVHGLLGSSIMTLFLIHAALGLQLGLSF